VVDVVDVVDVVGMRVASDVLNMEIITRGIQIHSPYHFGTELFATHKFSDYVRLSHYQRDILQDIN
jgi:hypothetical protein